MVGSINDDLDNAKKWASETDELLTNVKGLVDKMYDQLSEKDKKILDNELKSIDIKDISSSYDSIKRDLDNFTKNYKR